MEKALGLPLLQRNHKITVYRSKCGVYGKEWTKMSGEGSFGLNTAERFFGLLMLAVGIIALYYTLTSADSLKLLTDFFGFLSILLMALGLVLIIAKPE
jgi:hypothetical protein